MSTYMMSLLAILPIARSLRQYKQDGEARWDGHSDVVHKDLTNHRRRAPMPHQTRLGGSERLASHLRIEHVLLRSVLGKNDRVFQAEVRRMCSSGAPQHVLRVIASWLLCRGPDVLCIDTRKRQESWSFYTIEPAKRQSWVHYNRLQVLRRRRRHGSTRCGYLIQILKQDFFQNGEERCYFYCYAKKGKLDARCADVFKPEAIFGGPSSSSSFKLTRSESQINATTVNFPRGSSLTIMHHHASSINDISSQVIDVTCSPYNRSYIVASVNYTKTFWLSDLCK